jgi:ATP-dependent Clp protease ATP-binding subunit ClpA
MFERFTDRARRVIVLAQDEARLLDHNYIGTEHLLLGLIHEGEGVASTVLRKLEIGLDAVREKVEEIIGRGERPPTGHIPFTPQAKKVLELSLRESTQLGHNYIGTEHILLGLIREGDGVAAQVLTRLGADLSTVRQQVMQLLHGYRSAEPAAESAWRRVPGRGRLDEISDKLDTIAQRLTAIEGRLGMEEETEPDVLRRLDQRISHVAREKEAAIDAQEFKKAAELRDRQRQLEAERAVEEENWRAARAQQRADGTLGGQETDRLRGEVDRLSALLRRHGIDAGGEPPPVAAAGD